MQRFLQEIMKENNAWNIRCLGAESFVPANQQSSDLYCRLSDFTICCLSNGIVIARNDWAKIYLSKVQRVKSHEISHCSSIR